MAKFLYVLIDGQWEPVSGQVGPGVPPGGSTGQVLVKASAEDYDTQWVAPTFVVLAADEPVPDPEETPIGTFFISAETLERNDG
jgi:hypothetical protein